MKILSLANDFKNDIASSGVKLKRATTAGYCIADRTAKIYNLCSVHKYYNLTRSIGDKILKSTSKKELPYIAGAIGLFIPIPFLSPILMGIGFLLRFANFGSDTATKNKKASGINTSI